jgi:hypothetical protein
VTLHELTHVLGFSSGFYNQFIDPATDTVIPQQDIYESHTTTGANGQTYTTQQLIMPGVLSWIRTYFNCSTLTGAQLEDGGGPGTVLSHWEKKTFGNEYMTGAVVAESDSAFLCSHRSSGNQERPSCDPCSRGSRSDSWRVLAFTR